MGVLLGNTLYSKQDLGTNMFGVELSSQSPKKNFSMDSTVVTPSVVGSSAFPYSSVASPGLTEQVEGKVLNRKCYGFHWFMEWNCRFCVVYSFSQLEILIFKHFFQYKKSAKMNFIIFFTFAPLFENSYIVEDF